MKLVALLTTVTALLTVSSALAAPSAPNARRDRWPGFTITLTKGTKVSSLAAGLHDQGAGQVEHSQLPT